MGGWLRMVGGELGTIIVIHSLGLQLEYLRPLTDVLGEVEKREESNEGE